MEIQTGEGQLQIHFTTKQLQWVFDKIESMHGDFGLQNYV